MENELNTNNYENIINKYFKFTQVSLYNLSCKDKIEKKDLAITLELDISCNLNIYNSLENFFKQDKMEGDNKIFCSKCKKYYDGTKECFLKNLSKYLIIVLKRFKYNKIEKRREKINDYFEYPIILDLNSYILNNKIELNNTNNCKYRLKGTVIHEGTSYFGHNYSIVFDSKYNKWIKFNDKITNEFGISELNKIAFGGKDNIINELKDFNSYLIFYERLNETLLFDNNDNSHINDIKPDNYFEDSCENKSNDSMIDISLDNNNKKQDENNFSLDNNLELFVNKFKDLNFNNNNNLSTNISKNINNNDYNDLNNVNLLHNINNVDELKYFSKKPKNGDLKLENINKPKAKKRKSFKSEDSEDKKSNNSFKKVKKKYKYPKYCYN